MDNRITCQIETIQNEELLAFMRLQAEEASPFFRDEAQLEAYAKKWNDYATLCLCRDNGLLIGMIAFYSNRRDLDFAYITHVYVSSAYRRKGVFGRMLNVVVAYVQEKAIPKIKLEVKLTNIIARKVYEGNGFKEEGKATEDSVYLVLACQKSH